ncbi:MAG: response regulator [Deltaproteobacteria bacterium]|nr:response regulator [Deltaproteobacteria bacterium]
MDHGTATRPDGPRLTSSAEAEYAAAARALSEGDTHAARERGTAAAETAEQASERSLAAQAWALVGQACWLIGDDGGALAALLAALRHYEALDDALGVATCERQAGIAHVRADDVERALVSFRRALASYEKLGDLEGMAATQNNIGGALHRAGALDGARTALTTALELCDALDQPTRKALMQVSLATVLLGLGELDEAEARLNEAIAVQRQADDRHGLAHALEVQARLLRWRQDPAGAIAAGQAAVALAVETGNRPLQCDALEVVAEAAASSEAFELAYRSKRRAAQLASELERERRKREVDTLRMRFAADRAEGDAELARVQARAAEYERDQAQAATRARDTFVAHVSHEIRTPMSGVLGMTELLLGEIADAEHRRRLEVIRGCGQNLLHLINDLLDLSKLEAGGMRIEAIPFAPRALLENAIELLMPLAAERSLQLILDLDGPLPSLLVGDPHRISQMLHNLIGNALKFTPDGEVRVRCRVEGGELLIEVIDTGVGIPPDALQAVFEPFAQGEDARLRPTEGTGLGLAIVRRLCTALGGQCGAQSEKGVGSRFWIRLPFREATPLPVAEPVAPSTGRERKRRRLRASWSTTLIGRSVRVLVAEDDPVNQELARLQLKQHGADPLLVDRGNLAVRACASQEFDLVLMDLRMPEMDGIAAARTIRDMPDINQPLIVALTANATAEERQACLDAGMDGFVGKPLDAATLAGWLARAGASATKELSER